MPWMWVVAAAAFVLGVNLGVVFMGMLAADRRD
jgi:uncharacterized membrane-anchored protein YhcB (DUF1043 family)